MSTATDMLQKYLDAECAILEGKEARMGGRVLTLEDLDKVRAGRVEWERRVSAESAGSGSANPRRPIQVRV